MLDIKCILNSYTRGNFINLKGKQEERETPHQCTQVMLLTNSYYDFEILSVEGL